MALDQQRNWDISMAQNLHKIMRLDDTAATTQQKDGILNSEKRNAEAGSRTWNTEPIYLPDEIILQIVEYIANFRPYSQRTLASCCLLSHQWYSAAVPLLYERPVLYGNNFEPFLRAMCPSINLHIRKSVRAELVKSLNMANLVHQGSRSLTARLLGRTKGGLEEFVAPQASFAINCLPALSKCVRLRVLDLSLVSESPPLPELFKTVSHLNELRSFRLPRSAGFGAHHATTDLPWPPNLEDLTLSGGIDGHFLVGVVAFPQTLRSITIEHCPQVKGFALVHLLRTAIRPLRRLESLKIRHMPRLSTRALDNVLFLLPQLKKLSVSVDYITPAVFDEDHFSMLAKEPYIVPSQTAHWSEAHQSFPLDLATDDHDHEQTSLPPQQQHSLRTLELTSSGNPGVEDKITPIDVMIAIEEGTLPNLRQVRVTKSLHWHNSATAQDAEALADVLQERNKREWFEVRGLTIPEGESEDGSGVRAIMEGEERPWERSAGVWMFDG
ncbi:hypothetical protein LTR78_005766 [Recurvomyces mirabilis]|uniref:F-box domain-containing protein n=1 Tax=Recurvomyces mirabilis TaxID=574656 RepID=A0AAE0WM89_9PEZI|nr:hypothetical protein LTR78_005766 [Recurvomyces mirabilis]KAK5154145.1 hypothetical protein LTS14_006830 [Recurvomyces mirabilis]